MQFAPNRVEPFATADGETVTLRVTVVAAKKLALPTWFAVIVQVPADTNVSVVPLTVQIEPVVEASVTVNPEEEEADKVGVATPIC